MVKPSAGQVQPSPRTCGSPTLGHAPQPLDRVPLPASPGDDEAPPVRPRRGRLALPQGLLLGVAFGLELRAADPAHDGPQGPDQGGTTGPGRAVVLRADRKEHHEVRRRSGSPGISHRPGEFRRPMSLPRKGKETLRLTAVRWRAWSCCRGCCCRRALMLFVYGGGHSGHRSHGAEHTEVPRRSAHHRSEQASRMSRNR